MPFPISLIFGWLTSKGVRDDRAGPIAWVIAALIVIMVLTAGYQGWKALVIADHETERDLDRAVTRIERMEEGDAVDRELERRDDQATEELKEGARNAANDDPEGAARPVGPVSSDVHDRLRDQRGDR